MSRTSLPRAREVRVRLALLDAGVAGGALVLMAAYLHSLLDLSAEEWSTLATSTLVFVLLAAAGSELIRRLQQRPLSRFLAAEEGGTAAPSDVCEAFRSAIALPTLAQRNALVVWLLGTAFVALWMHLSGETGWGADFRMLVLIAAGVSVAALSAGASFFLVKREIEMLRETLASRIPEPEQRRALIHSVSLVRKLRLAVVGSVVLSLMLAILLGHSQTRQAVDSAIAEWQERAVSVLATELGDARDRPTLDRIVAARLPRPELMAVPAEFRVRLEGELATEGRAVARRIRDDLAAGLREGTTVGTEAPKVVVWKALGDGRVLLSSVSRQGSVAGLPRLPFATLAALVVATGVGLCVAHLLASDIRRAARKIGDAAERMANGDLRSTYVLESEDELGALGRSFERMGSELHATVARVAAAADRVDSAASQISAVSENVVGASNEQASRIEQAMDLMVRINDQVAEVSSSARALNLSVEESSSSILELGAAGEELNETASVLSSKVDEVSTSIEEMVRSVKHVRSIGDALEDAAAETSSSMEEMASAMRAVDNTAEMTASLSREVVESAESGQAKVSQTIEGMQAIREATDAAEAVIRGLGDRTKEIGAILDVIDDVADETNLLALNAAIIAAQAGEHGRAFSVVAEEIKELADRVLASTKEIGSLIHAVQGESSNAVGAIEDGSRSVASGVQLSVDAGVSLDDITRAARESGSHTGEIVAAVQVQTKAAGHVVELMDRVRNGVEQIAAAGGQQDRGNETVYRSAVTMSEVAQQVRRTTEEQSRGFARIRESVEGVRDAVEQINGSLQQQSSACSQVAEFLEQVVARSRGNARAAQGLGEAVQLLTRQAESLREDVARFQT